MTKPKAPVTSGTQFVVVYDDGFMKLVDEEGASSVLNLHDKGIRAGILDLLALNQDNELVSVRTGPEQRDPDYPGNNSKFYATKAMFAGKKFVGFAYYSEKGD
jgi:hypothetical protein